MKRLRRDSTYLASSRSNFSLFNPPRIARVLMIMLPRGNRVCANAQFNALSINRRPSLVHVTLQPCNGGTTGKKNENHALETCAAFICSRGEGVRRIYSPRYLHAKIIPRQKAESTNGIRCARAQFMTRGTRKVKTSCCLNEISQSWY